MSLITTDLTDSYASFSGHPMTLGRVGGGKPPYIRYMGMYLPKGYSVLGFGMKKRYRFCPLWAKVRYGFAGATYMSG